MKDEIRVGDLVMVVRWPCCHARVGVVYIVSELTMQTGTGWCGYCKAVREGCITASDATLEHIVPVDWLKRIDPPALVESTPTSEKVEA